VKIASVLYISAGLLLQNAQSPTSTPPAPAASTSQAPAAAPTPAVPTPPAAPATPPAAPPNASTTAPVNGKYELHDGDDVPLKFAQDLSSKTATEGDAVNFVLDGDIKVGEVVVIKSGTKAVGEVTNAKRAGMMGKGGELSVRIDYIRVGESKVRLRGQKAKREPTQPPQPSS
jgi:hypothetical protein